MAASSVSSAMGKTPPPQVESITCTYQPEVETVRTWLQKMVAERRFVELIVAVLSLIARLRDLNTHLMKQVAHLKRKRPPSETLGRLERQLAFSFIAKVSPDRNKSEDKRKRRRGRHPGRRELPAHLPRIEEPNPVPEELRWCEKCGQPMPLLGHQRCETLNVEPARVVVNVRVDETLYCPKDGTIVSAPPPGRIVPRGKLGDGFIIEALADKYLLNIPIERQCTHWLRQGIDIPPQTLGRGVVSAIDLLGPLAELITEQMRASDIVSIDATGIRLLDPESPEGRRFGTIWCGIGDGEWVSFRYWADASADGAKDLLGSTDLARRIVQSDGTATTNFVERCHGKRPGCWSHGRRGLVEAARSGDSWALDGLRIIAKLFIVEKIASQLGETADERQVRRQLHSRRVLDELRAWIDEHRPVVPPKSPLGKALGYLHRQWHRLLHFLEDGRIALTNNHVERALRPLVLGLKSWLFAWDDIGGKRTAIILTVLGTCIAQRINPRAFLHKAFALLVKGADAREVMPNRLVDAHPDLRMPARASPSPDDASLREIIEELEAKLAAPALPPAST
jgi:transposase